MAHKKRYILLAGAPDSDALVWDDSGLLSSFSIPSRKRYNPKDLPTVTSSSTWPKWRAVHLRHNDLQQEHMNAGIQTQFLSFGMVGDDGVQKANQDFLDHSVALLDNLHPSQLADVDITAVEATAMSNDDTSLANTSFVSGDTSIDAARLEQEPWPVRLTHCVTDIRSIPSATAIDKIEPQTVTINLIAGVISVSVARTVRLRKRNTEMDIVEVILGDDTRAGFAISVWLVPEDSQHSPVDDLRERLRSLRSGDIVLIGNMGLSTFRGCVYGQSLNRRLSKNGTTIKLLEDGQEAILDHTTVLKVKRVRAWANQFLGKMSTTSHNGAENAGTLRTGQRKELLPPDSQD